MYTVGWICAVKTEYVAACELLDEEYPSLPNISLHDSNIYTLGRVGSHDVVIACLPKGRYGVASAATVAKDMLRSFESIRIGLMVGIGGGAPSKKYDIRLGDVVVACPVGRVGGILPYKYGKEVQNKEFEITGSLNSTPTLLLAALNRLEAIHERKGHQIGKTVRTMVTENPRLREKYQYPGIERDQLYEPTYTHVDNIVKCDIGCDRAVPPVIPRRPRSHDLNDPVVHYGIIASADQLMKDALVRDRLSQQHGVLCFEMEAAGLSNDFPCVVIRGICDYSDSHKNDEWQGYAAATAAAFAKELLQILPTTAVVESQRVVDALSDREGDEFHVPFHLTGLPVTGRFVDRDREIQEMERTLLPTKTRHERKIHILYGMGGIGKTQLAIAYARKHQKTYSAIMWVNGESKDTVLQSFAAFSRHAGVRGLPDPQAKVAQQAPDMEVEMEAVLRWLALEGNRRWLMIFDNVDRDLTADEGNTQAYDVASFLPPADHGSILITSRLPALGEIGPSTEVGRLSSEQALELLSDRSGLQQSDTGTVKVLPVELPNVPNPTDRSADMTKLVERLGSLPLALVQAGRYMRETKTNCSKYLALYESSWSRLVAETPCLRDYDNGSIQTTWTVSYERIRQTNPTVATFLQLWAYLDRQDIWYELISRGRSSCRECGWLQEIAESEINFKRMMKVLLGYSLVESRQYTDSYSVHPVVHDWCVETISRGLVGLMMTAVKIVGAAVPDYAEAEYWVLQQRLLPHADQCARWLKDSGVLERIGSIEACDAFHNLGLLYADQGKLAEADEMYRRALDGYEKAWGPEHTSTLATINNLGLLYAKQGKPAEAEEMYRRALDGYEKAWGPEHTSTLDTVNNLGGLYADQGKLAEADEMYRRALDGKEKAWGPEHTSTLNTVNNLGLLYADQGKLAEAEEMYRRALDGYEKAWGPDGYEKTWGPEHTSTLNTVNNLGNLYAKQGKLAEADEMYRRALDGYEKAWGPEHTSTLDTVNNLGNLYADQGKLAEAEEMYRRALYGYENAFGPDHPSTIGIVNNLKLLNPVDQRAVGWIHPDRNEETYETNQRSQSTRSKAKAALNRLKVGMRRWKRGTMGQ